MPVTARALVTARPSSLKVAESAMLRATYADAGTVMTMFCGGRFGVASHVCAARSLALPERSTADAFNVTLVTPVAARIT